MRKIIVCAQVSRNGVMQAPGGPTEDLTKGFQVRRLGDALPLSRGRRRDRPRLRGGVRPPARHRIRSS